VTNFVPQTGQVRASCCADSGFVLGSCMGSPCSTFTTSAFGHRVQDFESKTLSELVRWVSEECFIDGGKRESRLMLCQQHLASTSADGAAFREPGQAEGAKKVSTLGVGFKPRERDVQQRVIGKEN
jgi:hypothetical protein